MRCFFEIARFISRFGRFLICGVIVIRQIDQIGFQVAQDIRTITWCEILPIVSLQTVIGGKRFFGVEYQAGKPAGSMDFDHPHMEFRGVLMERIATYKGIVGGTGIGVTTFVKIEFSQVAVDLVLVTAFAMAGKVFHH